MHAFNGLTHLMISSVILLFVSLTSSLSYSVVNVFVSKRKNFFFASLADVDAAAVDDISVTATPGGSLIIGMVGRLQFKVSAARIEDFLRGAIFVVILTAFSFC